MKKFLIAGALALALPVIGMAATFTNVQFSNGDVTISGQGNSTVQATFHILVPSGQVVEFVQTDIAGDNLAPVDMSVGGDLGLQEGTHDVTVSVKLPPNTGTYTLNVQGAGIYGGVRAISGNDNVVGSASFSSAIRVVGSDTTTNTTATAGAFGFSSFGDFVTALKSALGISSAPASSGACATLSAKMSGTVRDTYNSANVKLQGYLLSEGASIPALEAGASFGFYGPQTASAVTWFKTVNSCN